MKKYFDQNLTNGSTYHTCKFKLWKNNVFVLLLFMSFSFQTNGQKRFIYENGTQNLMFQLFGPEMIGLHYNYFMLDKLSVNTGLGWGLSTHIGLNYYLTKRNNLYFGYQLCRITRISLDDPFTSYGSHLGLFLPIGLQVTFASGFTISAEGGYNWVKDDYWQRNTEPFVFTMRIGGTSKIKKTNYLNSQQPDNGSEIHDKPGEFNLSVFTGYSLSGINNEMKSNMSSSGLDHKSPTRRFDPSTRKYPIFDIEATYYFNHKMGISLNGGLINNLDISGFQNFENADFIYMELESKTWSVSLNYTYRSTNKRHNIFIGPTLFIHEVKGTSFQVTPSDSKVKKPGTYLGYSLHLLQEKNWFIALKTNYRWAPKSETGPFVTQSNSFDESGTPVTNTSIFSPMKVNLSSLNAGLCLAVRM